MKTLYKFIGLFIISSFLIFTACEDTDQTYTGDPFIYFSDDAITIPESSSDIVSLSVLLADAPAKSNITVSIDVQLTAAGVTQQLVEGVDFEVLEPADLSTVTIPAGENSTDIQIEVFDNTVEDSAKYITLTLANAGSYVLGFPGSEAKKSVVITISDDDCAFMAENWEGQPTGTETYGSNLFDASATWTIDNTYAEATATHVRYIVTGLMSGIFDGWGETVTNGGSMYVILDYTDPLNPQIALEAVLDDPDGVGRDDYYATTENGAWGYYMKLDPNNKSTFSTCEKTLSLYYLVDVSADNGVPNDQSTQCHYNVVFE